MNLDAVALFSPRTSTTDRGSRIARLLPHFATCMTTSEIYNCLMYILSFTADVFKTATGSPWRYCHPDLASFRDTDLSKYFDTIPHAELLRCVARRIVDGEVLRLIKLWLKTPIEERGADGKRRLTGGKRSRCGTPQGGVVSPLLANLYMNPFLKHWPFTGCGEAFLAQIIAYADDFVILSCAQAVEAMMWTEAVMTKLALSLNEAKTSISDARKERFEFLGYSFSPHHWWKNGQRYLRVSPSKKSVQRIRAKISALLVPFNKGSWPEVRDQLNRLLSGWSAYFSYGTRVPAYLAVDAHVYDLLPHFLCSLHNVSRLLTSPFSFVDVFRELAVLHLMRSHNVLPPSVLP